MTTGVRAGWSNHVMVCAKCSKKIGGGFGAKGKKPLAKALRKHLRLKKGRKSELGIVEVKCLGVCPKGAVTVINAADSRHWHLVPAGADLDEVVDQLDLQVTAGG
nr:(2Fe-2S) ferredoxin domain-containing protein [Stakelama marina]